MAHAAPTILASFIQRKRRPTTEVAMRYLSVEQQKDPLLLVARVLLMLLFVLFGWQKLIGFSGTVAYMTSTGAPVPTVSAIIAVVMELVVGIAIILGFFTRPL